MYVPEFCGLVWHTACFNSRLGGLEVAVRVCFSRAIAFIGTLRAAHCSPQAGQLVGTVWLSSFQKLTR